LTLKHIVVTGVSTGIGYATTKALLERGYSVFGSVRSDEDLRRLSAELGERFSPLKFDVTNPEAVASAAAQVQAALGEENLTALINNAGVSCIGPLQHLPLDQVRRLFEVNVLGLLRVTQAFLPLLGSRPGAPFPRGRIVNLSSNSGKLAYPFMGAYAASKHAVEGLSDSLRRELLLYGIDVIMIEPGTTRTPIVEKAARQIDAFMDTDYAEVLKRVYAGEIEERLVSAIPVERVSSAILKAVGSPRPRARYPVPRKWLSGWIVPRLLPPRRLDRILARRLGVAKPSVP
jgi:NAD(P)-dependent dehydrogenase (short-subunit alcohol dehydrogenase family)